MLRHFLKTALRIFYRRKLYSLISLTGLILAFTVSFLILIYAVNELNVNREFVHGDRIYRVVNHLKSTSATWAVTVKDLAPQISNSIPEVEGATRLTSFSKAVKANVNKKQFDTQSIFVDNDFFTMFENRYGISSEVGFEDLYSVIITEKLAHKLSPNNPLIGKTLELTVFGKEVLATVEHVIDGFTENSNIQADIFLSMDLFDKTNTASIFDWHPFFHTFILVPPKANMANIQSSFDIMDNDHFDGTKISNFELQPFPDFYLDSAGLSSHNFPTGDIKKIRLFLTVAALLLVIAIVNYTILATANALYRQKEFGIRKSFGSNRQLLSVQTLSESLIMTVIALPVSIILTELLLPYANDFWGKGLDFHIFHNWQLVVIFFLLSILTGLISGAYLSFHVSRLNPTLILTQASHRKRGFSIRQGLIVVQIFIFVALTSFSILVLKQMDYFQSKSLGYNPKNLLVAELVKKDGIAEKGMNPQKVQSFLHDINGYSKITSASYFGMDVPPFQDNTSIQAVTTSENPSDAKIFMSLYGDIDAFNTLGLKIIDGRSFTEGKYDEILITETGIKYLELKNPIGKIISAGGECEIVGIVKDFHSQSFRRDIGPLLIRQDNPENLINFALRLKFGFRFQENSRETIVQFINEKINSNFPDYDFALEFQEDRILGLYENEQKVAETVTISIILILFISSMGLFALSLYESERRMKEIAIRKINGASTHNLVVLLSSDFTKWVILAFILACPVSYYFMGKWLENFIYQTLISWWIFGLTGLLTLVITWITISFQSIKAASRNPVISLRND